jgi:hypothetical protein
MIRQDEGTVSQRDEQEIDKKSDNCIDLLSVDDSDVNKQDENESVDDSNYIVEEVLVQPSPLIEASLVTNAEKDDDICTFVGMKGKNALSDFPHSREDCVTHPFSIDPLQFCQQCYCYVCDVKAAECTKWISHEHYLAKSTDKKWKQRRSNARSLRNSSKEKRLKRALQKLAL